jgi:NAD(P)-dependent dehydrogenase (short-subunit alcohol dehydrogenase family)
VTLRLEGHRTAVIGAGGAIGTAVCRAYGEAGACVCALDLDEDAARRAIADLPDHMHAALRIDVADPRSVEQAAEESWREEVVDSVVYCPGVVFTADVVETDWARYRELMAVNLDGAFYTAAAFGRRMLAARLAGSFLFISSTAGRRGEAGASAYCASKFALIGLVESFAAEVSGAGIRANAICPGNVESPMLRSIACDVAVREGRSEVEVLDELAHAGAARRLVAPAEVASAVVWLASPLASAITGESIRVDMGQLLG